MCTNNKNDKGIYCMMLYRKLEIQQLVAAATQIITNHVKKAALILYYLEK